MTTVIAIILLASNFTIINAQPQQQVTSQPVEIENGTTTPGAAATTFQSTNDDSFSVQVPDGWIIHDVNNTGSTLLEERTQGYGMLAQLCPEEQQGAALLSNASGSTNRNSINTSSCQEAQDVIHIIRYPNLETGTQLANNITAYHLQKLQEVGYRGIQIVNSTATTVNITNPQTSETITIAPAKFVEATYSTNFAPNEIRSGYFILTATNLTAPNVGTTKGYSVFYEGSSAVAAEITTTTSVSFSLPPTPLPPAVAQVFGSFELMAAPEVAEQAIVRTEQTGQTGQAGGVGQVGQSECDPSYPDVCIPPPPPDLNCDDVGARNFTVLSPDPHGFDGDNDGIGCDLPGDPGDDVGDGDGNDVDDGVDDGEDDGEDNSCHPSYLDVCIPPPPPDLNCNDEGVPENFEVSGSDPHGFDGDNDGIGCESGSDAPDDPGEEPGDGDDDNGGDGGEDDDNGGSEEPEPEPGDGDDDNGGNDDNNGGNGEGDEGEGDGGGEGNPNEFDDCIVPPGMDPGDVGC
jgi:hypothetical protein